MRLKYAMFAVRKLKTWQEHLASARTSLCDELPRTASGSEDTKEHESKLDGVIQALFSFDPLGEASHGEHFARTARLRQYALRLKNGMDTGANAGAAVAREVLLLVLAVLGEPGRATDDHTCASALQALCAHSLLREANRDGQLDVVLGQLVQQAVLRLGGDTRTRQRGSREARVEGENSLLEAMTALACSCDAHTFSNVCQLLLTLVITFVQSLTTQRDAPPALESPQAPTRQSTGVALVLLDNLLLQYRWLARSPTPPFLLPAAVRDEWLAALDSAVTFLHTKSSLLSTTLWRLVSVLESLPTAAPKAVTALAK